MQLPLVEWESISSLLDHLERSQPSLVIGRSVEAPSRFVACCAESVGCCVEIGVISNRGGSVACWLLPAQHLLFVGHDQAVTLVEVARGEVHRTERLEGAFFEFVEDLPRAQLLAVHELGVVAFSFAGSVKWRFDSADIVDQWRVAGDKILLDVMDSDSIAVELDGGQLQQIPT